MNRFATIRHLLRTDLRRFRFLIVGLAVLHAAAAVVERLPLPRGLEMSLTTLLRLAQIAGFGLLVAQVVLADSAAHTRSQWWTRPIGGATLLLAKLGFIVAALWAPLMAIQLAGWAWDGFSARQVALAAGELTLYTIGIGVLVAGLASASAGFWTLTATTGVVAAGAMASAGVAALTGLHGAGSVADATFAVVLFSSFAIAGGLCLAAVYVWRRRQPWVPVGLALVGLSPLWMPRPTGEEPAERAKPHGTISLVAPAPGEPRDDRLLFRNLAMHGLAEDQFTVPLETEFFFTDRDDRTVLFEFRRDPHHWAGDDGHGVRVLPVLRREFPAGTDVHFGSGWTDSIGFRTRVVSTAPGVDTDSPGRLDGELEYELFEVVPLGTLPLRVGSRLADGGHVIQIVGVSEDGGTLALQARFSWPRLLGSRELDERVSPERRPWSSWVLVAWYPEWEEAEIYAVRPRSEGGISLIRSWRDEYIRFARPVDGATAVELRAFRIVAKGIHRERFEWGDHLVEMDLTSRPGSRTDDATGAAEPVAAIESLRTIGDLAAFHADLPWPQREALRKRSEEILATDLDGALARVPWSDPAHEALVGVLGSKLDDARMPAFEAALARDPRLIEAVEARGWGERFRTYVVERLGRRDPFEEPAVLRLAAGFADPALTDDLSWHLVHQQRIDRGAFLEALAAQPGFEPDPVLEAAWERAAITRRDRDLVDPALRRGLPGSVEAAVRWLHEEGLPDSGARSRLLERLREDVEFDGPPEAFAGWVDRHAADLVFDEGSGRFRLRQSP